MSASKSGIRSKQNERVRELVRRLIAPDRFGNQRALSEAMKADGEPGVGQAAISGYTTGAGIWTGAEPGSVLLASVDPPGSRDGGVAWKGV